MAKIEVDRDFCADFGRNILEGMSIYADADANVPDGYDVDAVTLKFEFGEEVPETLRGTWAVAVQRKGN
jgi:hypothetical protein